MTLKERFDAKWQENPETGCWDWRGGRSNNGYGGIWSCGKTLKAHRVSYELHVGEIPDGLCVCHRCDRPCCVNPEHLFLGTTADNTRDKVEKGRSNMPKGEDHYRSTLTSSEVSLIREALDRLPVGGGNFLARWFGVDRRTISSVRHGKRWGHL